MNDTEVEGSGSKSQGSGKRWGHHALMIACCIPMLVIAAVLVATGAASPGFIVAALACMAMMAVMMGAMSHGDSHQSHSQ